MPPASSGLEVNLRGVREACQELLEKDDLLYVTVSDDVAEDKKSRVKKKLAEMSSSESEEPKSDGDEILELLMKAQKQKRERATGSDSRSRGGEKTQNQICSSGQEVESSQGRRAVRYYQVSWPGLWYKLTKNSHKPVRS